MVHTAVNWWSNLGLATQISVVAGVVGIVWAGIALLGWLLRRKWERAAVQPAEPELEPAPADPPPSFAGLSARPPVNTEGFLAREDKLADLSGLVADGKHVIWVTGPTQAGKTWLVSRWVEDNGDAATFGRFAMDEMPTLEAVLEGINTFLCRHGEQGFDAACKSPEVSLDQRLAALVQVLNERPWVLLLDSFEAVAADADMRAFVERLQADLHGSVVLLGSRTMLEWGDASAEVPVSEIGEVAGFKLLEDQGIEENYRQALYAKVHGLPGALVQIALLVRKRGAAAATSGLTGTAQEVGEKLLAETFEALSEGAQRLWTGVCLFAARFTPEAAREMCGRDDCEASWDELVQWKLLRITEDRAELHPLARSAGEKKLEGMAAWKRACAQRLARYYAAFAEAKVEDREAIETELENILAAARLAFEYREWDALWAMGYALGKPLHYAGRWTAREELLRLCADGGAKAKNQKERAAFTHNLGIALQDRGNLEEAESLYRQSLEVEREVGLEREEAQTRHGLAAVLEARGELAAAEREYQDCLRAYQRLGMRVQEVMALHRLGRVAQARGNLEEAEGLCRQSLEIAREVGDRRGEAISLHQLGMVAQLRGKLEEAEGLYRQSLEIEREVGDRPGEAQTVHQLGMVAQHRGKLAEAEVLYQQARDVFVDIGARREEAAVLHQLGMVAQIRANLEEAESFYHQSLEIKRDVGDRPAEAKSRHALAVVAQQQGKLDEAASECDACLQLYRDLGMRPEEARALYMKGMLAQDRGNLEEAEEFYQQSLKTEREVGDRPGAARTLWAMTLLAEEQGNLRLAVERMEQAYQMFEEMGLAEAPQAKAHLAHLRKRVEEES